MWFTMQFTFHINKIYVCNAVCTDIKLNWTFARNGVLLNMEVNYRLEFDIFISTDCEMKLCVCEHEQPQNNVGIPI